MTVSTSLYSTPYLGQVATRGRYPEAQLSAGTAVQMMSRILHFARAQMVGAKFLYLNTYGSQPPLSGAATGAVMTVRASIEYPIGTFTRLTFGGNASATIPDNGSVLSDPLSITIPDGAMFREWCWQSNPAGVVYSHTTQNVDATIYGATAPDYTAAGGTSGMNGQNANFGASAIIGMTDRPSVFIIGDSRQSGLGTYLAFGSNDVGNLPRPISGSYAYINAAVSGAALWNFSQPGALARFKPLSSYCSHISIGGGINDLQSGNTATALKTDLEGVIANYNPNGDKPVFVCTVEPSTTSTDGWATTANQTIANATQNGYRLTHNETVRAGQIVGSWGFFDLAREVEDPANPGKWLAPGYCSDGLHAAPKGELAQMRAVNPSYFGQKASPIPLS